MNIIYDIINAIKNKNMVFFIYDNKERIGEPHILGVTNNMEQLLLWQTTGKSSQNNLPEWRRFDVNKITNFKLLTNKFLGIRKTLTGKIAPFDKIIENVNNN